MANCVDSPKPGLSTEENDGKMNLVGSSQSMMDRAAKEKLIMKKQVSFSSDPDDNIIITGARDCLCLMASGSDFIKIKPGAREFQRHFFFNQESLSIHWAPSRKKDAKIMVDDIVSVQMGQKTESFRSTINEYPSPRCFSIILRDNSTVDLVALVPNEAYIWVKGLRCLVTGGLDEEHRNNAEELRDRWLEEIYNQADLNHDGTLEHVEFLELMEGLNKHLTTLHVVKKFKESELFKGEATLPLDKFKTFFKQMVNRPEVHVVLARYATNNDYLSAEDLQLFLQAEQGEFNISVEECTELIDKYEPTNDGRANSYMTVDGFSSFLMSEDNFPYLKSELDKSHPLSCYYVNTSYCSGVSGWPDEPILSEDNYRTVLQNNFRCIRLEIWDGMEGPQVWHRKESTNRLPLQQALQAINSSAFQDSELPLILNIENHCSPSQQVTVATLLKDIFGDRLFQSSTVPVLASLKNKVLIKGTYRYKEIPQNGDDSPGIKYSDNESSDCEVASNNTIRKRKKKEGPFIADKIDGLKFYSSFSSDGCNSVVELADIKVDSVVEHNSSELIKHTRDYYTFVYPKYLQKNIISPLGQWQCGCQHVSIYNSHQDFTTMLNRSMFMQDGGHGMALKPAILREECYHYSIDGSTHIAGIQPKHLNIRLISAQQLPKPEGSVSKIDTIDPYIVVRVIGIPADSHEYRTYAVKNNGFHPVWEEEVTFTILHPECAFLHILMLDDEFIGDDYIGQVLVPLKMIRQGFRHLPLCARDGSSLFPASVFVHIDMKDQLDVVLKRNVLQAKKRPVALPKPEQLRLTGVNNIDLKVKEHQTVLDNVANLYMRLRSAVMEFKQLSGLDCFSHIRHCLRLIDLRLQTNECALCIRGESSGVPQVTAIGVITVAAVQKAIAAFEAVSTAAQQMQTEGESAEQKLVTLISNYAMYRKDIMDFINDNSCTIKKRQKALTSYSYNLWLLKESLQLYQETIVIKHRFSKDVFAHTGFKIKRGSWMLKKAGSSSSGKLTSITEDSDNDNEQSPNTSGEVFVLGDGILRPSTKEPMKSALKRPTTPPIDYKEFLRDAELDYGDI